jgi:hypothetical protein
VPVLGREEDAADGLAALVLLELALVQARRVIDAIAFLFLSQAPEETLDQAALVEEHSLTAQSLYHLLRLAYGADRGTFGHLVEAGALPKARRAMRPFDCRTGNAQAAGWLPSLSNITYDENLYLNGCS